MKSNAMVEDPEYARQVEAELEQLEAEIESLEDEEDTYEFVDIDLSSLSEEQLKAHVELLDEQIDQAKQRMETNRRAINLGFLKKANRARRCSIVKADGQPCRAPAIKDQSYCVFHARAAQTQQQVQMQVGVLEDPESMQITLKQIMEQVVSKRIDLRDAAVLLRAVQIAGSTLKRAALKTDVGDASKRPPRAATIGAWGNPEGNVG